MAGSCNINFRTLVNVAGDSGAFASALPKQMDNATTVELLDFLHNNSTLDLDSDRYKLGSKIMKQRPSSLAGKLYEYHGGQDRLALPDTNIQTDAGTLVHEIAASTGQLLTSKLKPGQLVTNEMISSISRQLLQIANDYPGSTKLDIYAINTVASTVAALINEAITTQNKINPNVLPTFRFEHRLLNPVKDIGGTADMLVLYSDNTASYFDYKTFEPAGVDKGWNEDSGNYIKNYGAYKSYRREKWEVSIPAYIQILKDTYKVVGIRHARAIPIATFFKKTDEYVAAVKNKDKLKMEQLQAKGKTRTATVSSIETFVLNNSLLLPAVIQVESTGDNVLDKFIADRYKEIEELRRAGGSSESRARNRARIEELQIAIDRLTTAKDIGAIIDLANKLIIESSSLLKAISENKDIDNRLESIRQLRNELSYYKDITDLTARYLSSLTDQNLKSKVSSSLGEVLTKMSIAKSALDTVYLNEMSTNNLIHKGVSKQELDAGVILFEQDDLLQKWAKGASNSNNPFLVQMKSVHDKLEKQKRDMLKEFERDSEKYFTGLQEFMKQVGWSEQEFIKFIVNKRGNLVHKFSSEMYDLINTAIRERNSSFFINNYTVKDNYEASYKRRLARKEVELKTRFNITEDTKDKSNVKKYEEALQNWIEDNALFIDGHVNEVAWSKQSNVRYFLRRTAEFESKYYSSQYNFMTKHPKLKDWYDFWQRTMYSAKDMLGGNEKVTANLIPWVAKESLELAVARGGNVAQDMLNAVSMNQDDPTEEYDAFGNLIKSVPIMYLSPFKRKTAEGKFEDDLDKKSFNLQKSLMLFMEMAINYDLKTKSEASIMAIKDMMVDFGQVYQLTKQGHVIIDPVTGRPKTGNEVSKDIIDTFNDYMNFYWYGMRISTPDKTINAFGREVSMQKSLLAAKNMYARKVLAFSLHAPLASWAVGRVITTVQGSKGLLFDHTMHANAIKWWAESKASTFSSSGSNGKKYKAFLTYFDPQNESLVDRINSKYQSSRIDKYLGNRAQFAFFHHADEAVIDTLAIAIAQNYGIKDGVLRHKDNLEQNDKSLWELFTVSEKDGEVVMDIELPGNYTEEQKKELKDQIWIKYRKIVREAQRSVIGSISDEEISLLSTNLYGNLALQFRTWLPNVAYEMFKGLKYDETYDAVDIGRLTALADSFKGLDRKSGLGKHGTHMISTMVKLLGEVLFIGRVFGYDRQLIDTERAQNVFSQWQEKHPQLAKNVTFDDYVKARRRQMIALISQLRILAMLTVMMMVVSMDWDDDDEKDYRKSFATRHGFRILNRIYTEFASMLNPGELNKLISGGPIPTWGLITSVAKLFNNSLDEIRDTLLGENSSQDETPFFYYTIDFIPLLDRLRKIMELTDADKRSTR